MSGSAASDEASPPHKAPAAALPWELVASLLGAVSGLSLFLSIVFDMGYFETIGLSFADVPTTIGDHVRSALLWVPQATTTAFAYVLVELMQKRFGGLFEKEGLSLSEKQAVVFAIARRWAFRTVIAAAFIVVWADALTGGQFAKYAAVASTITIPYLVFAGATHMASNSSLTPTKVVLLCLFPIATMFVYNSGKTKAIEEKAAPRAAVITLEGQREVQLAVYRYLDRGVLGVVGEGRMVFYRWEKVEKLTSSFQARTRVNWLCQSLGVACVKAPGPAVLPASAAVR